jgi:hypothetical protein
MLFCNQPSPAPLSPSLPECQTASYITYKERHIRPHAYRPFRIPKVKEETTAHGLITRLLSLGDHVPLGAFLPASKPRGPVALKPATAVNRVDRPSKEEYIETSTLPKLSLRRQRTIHPTSPAAATSLGRGASCSSTASTIRPTTLKPTKAAKVSKPLPSLRPLKVLPPLPSLEITTTSHIKDTSSPSSSEDEEVITPQQSRDIELPSVGHDRISEQELEIEAKGTTTMPGTPLNIPPTPLDIPVDWDDLRQRWSPHKSANQSAQEEGWCEEDDAADDDIFDRALTEEEEPPAHTHAYAAGGMAPSTSVSEIKLSSITSKDLGEYFLLEPMELQLHPQPASTLFREGWLSRPTPIGAQDETVQGPTISPTPGVGFKCRNSSLMLDADVHGSNLIRSPTAADFPLPPATVPRSSLSLDTRTSIEPLPKAALGPTTKVPTSLRPALKPQGQTRKKRHGRLVSFGEAELVMRTVRFSGTLDPQFDYTRFGQRKSSTVSIDSRVIEEVLNAGPIPHKESSPTTIVAGESFLSVLSPLTPTVPRR